MYISCIQFCAKIIIEVFALHVSKLGNCYYAHMPVYCQCIVYSWQQVQCMETFDCCWEDGCCSYQSREGKSTERNLSGVQVVQ